MFLWQAWIRHPWERGQANCQPFTQEVKMAFNPQNVIRSLLGQPPIPDPPAPVVAIPAQPPAPAAAAAPPAAANGNRLPGEVPGQNEPARPVRPLDQFTWQPIQSGPGFAFMEPAIRGLMSGYTDVPIDGMTFMMSSWNWQTLVDELEATMTEIALPPALSAVQMARHLDRFDTVNTRLFTNAERTESILLTEGFVKSAFHWNGSPRAELIVPVRAVAAGEATTPEFELPEPFNRPLREPPVYPAGVYYQQMPHIHGNFAAFNDAPLMFEDDQEEEVDVAEDVVTADQVRNIVAAAWVPVPLAPGYINDRYRATARAILSEYSPMALEDMQMIHADFNGQQAVETVLRDLGANFIEFGLPPNLSRPYDDGEPSVRIFSGGDNQTTLLYTSEPVPIIYKWAGGPVPQLLPMLEAARQAKAAQEIAPVADAQAPEVTPPTPTPAPDRGEGLEPLEPGL